MRNSDWPFPATASTAPKMMLYVGAAVGLFLLYKLVTSGVRGTAAAITSGAIDAGAGVVIGAGEAVGIPQTNLDQCSDDIYAGRTWDASFSCPAATFIRYLGGVKPPRSSDGLSGYAPRRRRSFNRNC